MNFNTMIVEGEFARISTGNCTWAWVIDGPDLEDRARRLWEAWEGGYYGPWSPAHIYERGFRGFGVMRECSPYADVFADRHFAEAAA
jgi:hypothetical protein